MFFIRSKHKLLVLLSIFFIGTLYYYFKDTIDFINDSVLFDEDIRFQDNIFYKYLEEDDPQIYTFIKDKYLHLPSKLPYNLNNMRKMDYSMGQSPVIHKLFNMTKEKSKRFFIECGAYDGETRSNSLYFEKIGWSGILIEADPKNFAHLISKNRKCFSINACLCPTNPHPRMVSFVADANLGHIQQYGSSKHITWDQLKSNIPTLYPCFSLYSIILSLKFYSQLIDAPFIVDYFSLDVEGAELEVLKTIPYDKIHIKAMTVEFAHVAGGKEALIDFLAPHGFILYQSVERDDNLANDLVFANRKDFPQLVQQN